MDVQYIYLLKEREFVNNGQNIFKIGKSRQRNTERFRGYPNDSILLFQMVCANCDRSERMIIRLFREKYIHKNEIGNEYFEGDYKCMIQDIFYVISTTKDIIDINDSLIYNKHEKDYILNINTFEEYRKYTTIQKIIINKKREREGYIQMKNKLWIEINDNTTITLDNQLHQYSINTLYKNKYNDELLTENEYIFRKTLDKDIKKYYDKIRLKYTYDKIIEEIVEKCYTRSSPSYYIPKYHEYVLKIDDEYKLYNSLTNTYNDLDTIENKIITEKMHCGKYELQNYNEENTKLLNELLNTMIAHDRVCNKIGIELCSCKHEYKLKEYIQLCKSIFIEPSKNGSLNIFYDLSSTKDYILSEIIYTLLETLTPSDQYINSKEYNIEEIKSEEVKKKNNKIRCIFIDGNNQENLDKELLEKKYTNLGIKNIIIRKKCNKKDSIYDNEKLSIYLEENKSRILKMLNNDKKDYTNEIINNPKNLFNNENKLISNMVLWVCGGK